MNDIDYEKNNGKQDENKSQRPDRVFHCLVKCYWLNLLFKSIYWYFLILKKSYKKP